MSTNETWLPQCNWHTIDDYRRLRPTPVADAPFDAESRAEGLYHPDDSDNDLRRDIRATGMDGRWSMSSEVAVRRIWKLFRRFLLFLCFLLFSSLLFSLHPFFGSRPGTNGVGTGFYHLPMEVEFPRAPDPPKGRYWALPIGCGTYGFVWLRTLNGCLITPFHSLSFLSLVLALAAQEVCA